MISFLNGNQDVAAKLKHHLPEIAVSSVVFGELLYGARAPARSSENVDKLTQFRQIVLIADFNEKSAEFYSKIRLSLHPKGRPTGEADMMNNIKHFENIENLNMENWLR